MTDFADLLLLFNVAAIKVGNGTDYQRVLTETEHRIANWNSEKIIGIHRFLHVIRDSWKEYHGLVISEMARRASDGDEAVIEAMLDEVFGG